MRVAEFHSANKIIRRHFKYLRYRNGRWYTFWEGSPLPPILVQYTPTIIHDMQSQVIVHRSDFFTLWGELE